MSYQVLARKYRPQKFSEVIGQDHVTRTLRNAIEQKRIAHGYIFSGHRGIGKTTIARILAMALNCRSSDGPVTEPCGVCDSCTEIRAGNSVDVIEIDAATNRGIDEIRELRESARYRPARDRFKIYILDEAHQITDAAFNALLKTLEEPPSHMVFMMATTQPEDIPQTIRSRCQHFSFHAVKFEEILGQLRDLSARENIAADEDALALLAEAGDGSVRDALSILDQAIASSGGRLTSEQVRLLVGSAPSGLMEEVMAAVARGASEEVLRSVDRLLSDGQNPTHFARQLVRFLRNTLVAKVAGGDSSLLQISSDERQRVARVAEHFSEEDLSRHLQIMLRTHGELGYRQEQRFHLELGLLKMTHAQRLLPLEQWLSEATAGSAAGAANPRRDAVRPAVVPEARRTDVRAAEALPARTNVVSPFESDSARKGGSKPHMMDSPASGGRMGNDGAGSAAVVVGSAAPIAATAVMQLEIVPQLSAPDTTLGAPAAIAVTLPAAAMAVEELRKVVLDALGNQRMLAAMLESGEWRAEANEVSITVPASSTVIDMSLSADSRRLIVSTATAAMGRPMKLKVLPGGTPQVAGNGRVASNPSQSNGGGRSRAEQDPIVQRMKEKFGAEVRTVIDLREKR